MSDLKEKMINVVKDSKEQSWFTIPDFQGATGATASEIITVINSNNEFVKSNKLGDDNLSRFSTRDEFTEKTSLFDKLKGAFKNTLD